MYADLCKFHMNSRSFCFDSESLVFSCCVQNLGENSWNLWLSLYSLLSIYPTGMVLKENKTRISELFFYAAKVI